MTSPLQVAVIGSGAMGHRHTRHWQAHPQANVRMVVDADTDRAAKLAAEFSVSEWVADYHDVIDRDDIDVIVVALPTTLHPEVTIAAAQNGKHVLCEKPIALSVSDGERMIAAARESGVTLGIGLMRRYSPAMGRLADWLGDNTVGRPVLYHVDNRFPIRPKRAMHDAAANGGPLVDMLCHYTDTWRAIFRSEPVSVMASGLRIAADRPELSHIADIAIDTASVSVRFASGDIGSYATSWGLPPGAIERPEITEQIYAPGGRVIVKLHGGLQRFEWFGEDGHQEVVIETETDTYEQEIDAFIRTVLHGEPLATTGYDGLMALKVSMAALESIRTGQAVEIR